MSQNTEITRPRGRGTAGGFFAQMLQEQLKKKKKLKCYTSKSIFLYIIFVLFIEFFIVHMLIQHTFNVSANC